MDMLTVRRSMSREYDANLDWCEPNYVFSNSVAEFCNVATVWPALFQWSFLFFHFLRHREHVEARFYCWLLTYMTNSVCGMIAHATLWDVAGVFDELSLIWLNLNNIFMYLTLYRDKIEARYYIGVGLTICFCFVCILMSPIFGQFVTVFFAALSAAVGIPLIIYYGICDTQLGKIMAFLIPTLAGIGGICALLDSFFCSNVRSVFWDYSFFHSIWHFTFQLAVHIFFLAIMYLRMKKQYNNDEKQMPLLPYKYFPFFMIINNEKAYKITQITSGKNSIEIVDMVDDEKSKSKSKLKSFKKITKMPSLGKSLRTSVEMIQANYKDEENEKQEKD